MMKKTWLCGLIVGFTLCVISPVFHFPYAFSGSAFAQQVAGNGAKTDYLKIGFALMKESLGPISVGATDSSILKTLSEPDQKSAAKIWAADGLEHQRWVYHAKGIELDMVRKEITQTVNMIKIKDPCDYKTQRGIQIGSSDAAVQSAYKDEIYPSDGKPNSSIIAGSLYGGIIFDIKDNIVTAIFIGAAAE
jgi:hypothetical protein